jgi:hypothetical protein
MQRWDETCIQTGAVIAEGAAVLGMKPMQCVPPLDQHCQDHGARKLTLMETLSLDQVHMQKQLTSAYHV